MLEISTMTVCVKTKYYAVPILHRQPTSWTERVLVNEPILVGTAKKTISNRPIAIIFAMQK